MPERRVISADAALRAAALDHLLVATNPAESSPSSSAVSWSNSSAGNRTAGWDRCVKHWTTTKATEGRVGPRATGLPGCPRAAPHRDSHSPSGQAIGRRGPASLAAPARSGAGSRAGRGPRSGAASARSGAVPGRLERRVARSPERRQPDRGGLQAGWNAASPGLSAGGAKAWANTEVHDWLLYRR